MGAQVNYKAVLDFYSDDLFGVTLAFQKPLISSYEFLRKKHAGYKFKRLLELKHLSKDDKEKIVMEFLKCLPKTPSAMAYLESYERILKVFSEHFGETVTLLEEVSGILSQQEQEKIVKIQMQKSEGVISSVRNGFSEMILDSDEPETVMVIDQAFCLAELLIRESLKEKDEHKRLNYSLHLLMLLLRVEAIKRGMSTSDVLYGDIALISGVLKKPQVSEVPEESWGIMGLPG